MNILKPKTIKSKSRLYPIGGKRRMLHGTSFNNLKDAIQNLPPCVNSVTYSGEDITIELTDKIVFDRIPASPTVVSVDSKLKLHYKSYAGLSYEYYEKEEPSHE